MARDRFDDRDDRDDDRPRRRDRDDDDRPRRSYRRDDGPPARRTSVLGIFALIIAIPSLIMAFVPCLNIFAVGSGLLAALLGIVGLVTAKGSNGQVGSGLPLTGMILGFLAALIAVAMLFVYMAIAASLPTTQSPNTSIPADAAVSAVELDEAYADNVVAADAKYKGKIIDVTGVVERVSDEIKKFRLTVELTGTPGSTVDCDFSTTEKAALAGLKTGTKVTIRGKCIGRRTVDGDKWVTLENCVIVTPESKTNSTKPTTAGTTPAGGTGKAMTPSDLAQAFASNEVAANAKYTGKEVEVSGSVLRMDISGGEEWYVWYGKSVTEVECRFKKGAAGVSGLNPKNAATIRGKCTGLEDGVVILEDCTLVK